MDLIIKADGSVFNTEAIEKGNFIRAKYSAWDEARNGLVVLVTREEIRVIWQPGIRNVTNFFTIEAGEVEAGLWEISWTADMETINKHPADTGGPGG